MTMQQITTIRCAYIDLRSTFTMFIKREDLRDFDWDEVELTLGELEANFDLELEDLIELDGKVSA